MQPLQKRIRSKCFSLVILLLAPCPAIAQTVVESKIAQTNPCKGAKTKVGFVNVGIDKLKDVELESADVSLRGNAAMAAFVGSLSCKTSDTAVIKGDASTRIDAKAEVDLASCEVGNIDVTLSQFGGTFGGALELLSGTIEAELADVARQEIASACQDFRDGD